MSDVAELQELCGARALIPDSLPDDLDAARRMKDVADAFTVDGPQMYELAGDELITLKRKHYELDAARREMTKPLDEAKKRIMAWFRGPLAMLEEAQSAIKREMLVYDRKVEEERREKERVAAEALKAEQERLQAEADAAAEAGKAEEAEVLQAVAESTPALAIVEHKPPKVEGISTRTTWSAEVTDKMALIKAVYEGVVPDAALEVNTKLLNQQARALKEQLKWPGVRAVASRGIAARR